MALVPILVDQGVVCVGLGDKMSGTDGASIGVRVCAIEQDTVELFFSNSGEGIVKSQINNLWPIP